MSRLSAVKPAYWISGVLLAIAIVVPLLVSTYAKDKPRLWGFPFFYWYQLMWVFLSAILVSICYRLVSAEERRRRAAQGLGDPERPRLRRHREGGGPVNTSVNWVAADHRRGDLRRRHGDGLHGRALAQRGDGSSNLDEWGLGGRGFGTWITWFLLGGDLYTAYTFIAVPAAMYATGAVSGLLRRAVHDRGLPDHLHLHAPAVVGLAPPRLRHPGGLRRRPVRQQGAVAGGGGHRDPRHDALHRAAAGRHPGRARGDRARRHATRWPRTCRCSSRSRCWRPTPTPRVCGRRR